MSTSTKSVFIILLWINIITCEGKYLISLIYIIAIATPKTPENNLINVCVEICFICITSGE